MQILENISAPTNIIFSNKKDFVTCFSTQIKEFLLNL